MVNGEWPFIDGEFKAMRENHGIIIGLPSMEVGYEDFEEKRRECHMETTP